MMRKTNQRRKKMIRRKIKKRSEGIIKEESQRGKEGTKGKEKGEEEVEMTKVKLIHEILNNKLILNDFLLPADRALRTLAQLLCDADQRGGSAMKSMSNGKQESIK